MNYQASGNSGRCFINYLTLSMTLIWQTLCIFQLCNSWFIIIKTRGRRHRICTSHDHAYFKSILFLLQHNQYDDYYFFFSDVEFGDQKCEAVNSNDTDAVTFCEKLEDSSICIAEPRCNYNYTGSGIEYQILAGPAFIAVFTFANIITGLTSDRIAGYSKYIGRHTIMAVGVVILSISCLLMGFSNAYWQLVILRMGIALGNQLLAFSVTIWL